jgi:hypothetical protein
MRGDRGGMKCQLMQSLASAFMTEFEKGFDFNSEDNSFFVFVSTYKVRPIIRINTSRFAAFCYKSL